MKKVAVLTMVRNDRFFLQKWVEYYGGQFGRENLFIYYDGTDQVIDTFCEGTNAILHKKIGSHVLEAEKGRLDFLSSKAAELFKSGYDLVIGVDADEYIVVDPQLGKNLRQYLSEADINLSLSPLGLDFGQKLNEESDLTLDRPFLHQRRYAQIGTRYTKPSIISQPCKWGRGFHRIKGHNFHLAKHLYLLHFGYSDLKMVENRLSDVDRNKQGWHRHIIKRSRTIRLVTQKRAFDFDRWIPLARICQIICRPLYALNKPSMLELKVVVALPDRFKDIL